MLFARGRAQGLIDGLISDDGRDLRPFISSGGHPRFSCGVVDMKVSESPSTVGTSEDRLDLTTVAVGLAELGARGLRVSLGRSVPGEVLFDVGLGAAVVGGETASRAAGLLGNFAPPRLLHAVRLPRLPRVPSLWRRLRVIEELQQRGREERLEDGASVRDLLDRLATTIIEEVLRHVDVAALVQQYVDLEAIIAGVDLDAVVDTVDVDRVAGRLDVDAVLDRVDLTAVVRDRVDLDAIVDSVDIDAVAARLDLDAIIQRLDLPALAQRVIDDIDLPGIIRESSGSMASEAVQGVRMHSIEADDAVAHTLDRLLRHRHSVPAATAPLVTMASEAGADEALVSPRPSP
jgi:hypothetical protein